MRQLASILIQKLSAQLGGTTLQPRLGDLVDRVKQAYRRRYYRHVFVENDVAFVKIQDESYRVLDISYGGIRIALNDTDALRSLHAAQKEIQVEVLLLAEPASCAMKINSLTPQGAGLRFDPRSSFGLLFLHRYLSFMDAGILIKALPKHNVRSNYQTPDWLSYGDAKGMVEVHLHMDMIQAHVYYVNGSRHDYVWFRPDRTSVSCSPRQELSIKEKKEILSRVICLLLGMRQIGKTDRLDLYIQRGIQKLKRPSNAA